MMQPFLTIGIPTWNRCAYLKINLEALVAQIALQHLQGKVEVLVSDNGSSDGTQSLVEEMSRQYPSLRYHRHPQNRGANANFQFVIENANGQYVWLLGDDDLLVENIINRVIDDIQQYQPDVVVGPAVFDVTQEKATHLSFKQLLFTHKEILIQEEVIAVAGKMSGLIFKRSSVLPVIARSEPIIQATRTPWPHLAWFILLLNDIDKSVLLLPYGVNQLVAANWHNLLFNGKTLLKIHFIEYQALLVALQSQLDPLLYRQLINRSVTTRQASLLKCVLYATYLDGYWEMLALAMTSFWQISGLLNKMNYILFLCVPLMIPRTVRKMMYYLCQKRWSKLRVTIERINHAKKLLAENLTSGTRQYNEQQL